MAEQSSGFPASITVTKLYERTSAKGNQYMTGHMAGVKIAILKTNDTDEQGHPIWELKFSPAPSKPARQADASASQREKSSGSRGFGSDADDSIPF